MVDKRIMAITMAIIVDLVLSITALILNFIPLSDTYSATDIYEQCLYNVVEVKAESEDIGESFGTGEILSKNGKIITNAHVVTYTRLGTVNEFEKYYVRFAYEDKYRIVKLEKYDTDLDLAVLSFESHLDIAINPIKQGDSNKIRAGDNVYAVGNASNYGIGIFNGIVSIPLVNIELEGLVRAVIQCDLTIAAGNSGGALINDHGELIGITTFRTKDTLGNVIYGIVYCIPINIVLEYTNE